MAPKNFLEFWRFRNCFSLSELSLRLRTCKGSKKGWWHHNYNASWFPQPSLLLLLLLPFCKLLYILANHSTSYLSIWPVVRQTGLKANLLVLKRIKMVFKDFWLGQFWTHVLHVFLRIIITIQKKFVSYTLTPHLSSILYLSHSQWSSHPPTIAILLLPFPFQPFAFKWFLIFVFFLFFPRAPKSLLRCCCSFGPVLVHSSSIYAASPLYS